MTARSREIEVFFPKVLGFALTLGGFAYVVDLLARFLASEFGETISPYVLIPMYSEIVFVAYLLVKGVRERDHTRSPRSEVLVPDDHVALRRPVPMGLGSTLGA